MKKTIYTALIALLAMTALNGTAGIAAESLTGSVTAGPEFYIGDEDNAKFNEYHYKRDTVAGGMAELNLLYAPDDSSHRLTLDLNYESPQDVKLDIGSMSYGTYNFFACYQRFGHVFAYDVKSLYSGNTTGRLTLPSTVASDVEAAGSGTAIADVLDGYVASAGTIDMQLVRDRLSTGLEWMKFKPLDIKASFDYEHRSGSRPFGGNFGFGDAVEIPEPINYDTYNARLDAEYASDILYASLGYFHSTFNNADQSVTFDNPLSTVDSVGRFSLPPSNTYNEVHMTLAKSLPLSSRLTTNFSYGWMRQNESLLPYTVSPDPALSAYTSTSVLPRLSADAKVDRFLADAVLTARPIDKLHVKVTGRYYMHNNNTPEEEFVNVRADVSAQDPEDTEYVSWISREVGTQITYEVFKRTNVGFEYKYESESYLNGSAGKERINTFRVTGDTFAVDWMNARVILEYLNRESAYPSYVEAELPWMRKFYAADLARMSATLMTDFTVSDGVDLGLEYVFSNDNYSESIFGLQDGWHHAATLDLDYSPSDNVSVYAFYTYENHETKQMSRRWTPGSSDPFVDETTPDSASNWSVDLTEQIHSVGLGGEVGIIPGRLKLKLDGIFSLVDGKADYDSPVGALAVTDNNRFVPQDFGDMDDTTWWKVGAGLEYALTKKISINGGYRFESWDINDYTYDGVTEVKRNTSGAYNGILGMDSLYRNYDVHTIYLLASYTFD
jgi:MtrB/PioB family decaheme-associated outer membrane protein